MLALLTAIKRNDQIQKSSFAVPIIVTISNLISGCRENKSSN